MKKKEDIACPNCGKLFHPARKESKFCCRQCGIEYNKAHGLYKKSDEMKAKLSAARTGKDPWNKGRKMTQEEIDKMKVAVKAAWTEEKKETQRIKQKEVWANPELLKRHSRLIQDKMTEEIKQLISKHTKLAMQREDVKQHIHESFNRSEVKEKRKITNNERYGVNWIVQSELYTKAGFKGKTNDRWDNFLDFDNKKREFPLED
jgi:predicted  nucleic acid-binding Zn-ribbon protein